MDEKIILILNEMSEYLSITQMKKLQEVIIKRLRIMRLVKLKFQMKSS